MVILKEDIDQAKERLRAWWDHEVVDRPCIGFYYPRPNVPFKGIFDFWYLAKNPDDIKGFLDDFEGKSQSLYFGAENLPYAYINYGPMNMASIFGAETKFQSNTVWYSKPTHVDEIVSLLERAELNANNPWYARFLRSFEYAAQRAKNDYCITMPDISGVLDTLLMFLGPTNIILTMKRKPELIDTCRAIILEKTLKFYADIQKIVARHCDGFTCWLNVWCPKIWYPIQCDLAYMLSPAFFKRFVLPDVIATADSLEHAIYHLDGVGQLPFLDDLLAVDSLDGIQWVPGAGKEAKGHEKWLPIYKKIQAAGKNIVIDDILEGDPSFISQIYNNLDPRGLFMCSAFLGKDFADFYLPEFVGGYGAKGSFREFKKMKRTEKKEEHKKN